MPDAILHIGFNKCGSTALQKWLGDHRNALLRQGVLYQRMDPRPDVVCTNPHLKVLAYSLAGLTLPPRRMNAVLDITDGDRTSQDRVAEDFRRAFEARVAEGGFGTWVGSSEALVSRDIPQAAVSALADWLSGLFGTVRYVAYIRRPEDWLVSLYGHAKRTHDLDETLSDFAQRIKRTPFAQVLARWETAAGRDALDVRLFEESWLTGVGLVEDFRAVLGLTDGAIDTRSKVVNVTYRRGLRGLPLLGRGMKRPALPTDTRDLVRRENAAAMDWIEGRFFADRCEEFRAWAGG